MADINDQDHTPNFSVNRDLSDVAYEMGWDGRGCPFHKETLVAAHEAGRQAKKEASVSGHRPDAPDVGVMGQ